MRKRSQEQEEALQKLTYTVDEAARMMSLGRNSMYELVMSNKVMSFKVGNRRLVPHVALVAFVEDQIQTH